MIAVIYSVATNVLRRVIVSDELTLDRVGTVDGEAAIEVPFDAYSMANDAEVRAYVASQIGEPAHDGRCVEVDASGKVVAVYSADPAIDKPMLRADNAIELHASATVGDLKVNGEFPVKVAPPVNLKPGDKLPFGGVWDGTKGVWPTDAASEGAITP